MLEPTYGVILIQPIGEEVRITYGSENKGKIIKGKAISVGPRLPLDGGLYFEQPCKKDDVVYFLHYEGGYDACYIDGVEYIWAAFKDVRGIVK